MKKWTTKERKRLKALIKDGVDLDIIANEMQRSRDSIEREARRSHIIKSNTPDVKEFILKNFGKDKIPGRPIRLNKVTLMPKPGKDYAEMIFFGDLHFGYPTCNLEAIKDQLRYVEEKGIYMILMGDLIEAGLRDSVGDSVYRQNLNPQEQMEAVVELLTPCAKKGLIIGLHSGNHEMRITKNTGIDISKIMSKMLGVRYLGYSCWSLLSVNGIRYSLYSTHGVSGSKFKHTKLKTVLDICAWVKSDIVAMGHVHSIASEINRFQTVDFNKQKVVEMKQYVCLTGSYLEWDKSYAQDHNFPPTATGSPKAKLMMNRKDVYFSF